MTQYSWFALALLVSNVLVYLVAQTRTASDPSLDCMLHANAASKQRPSTSPVKWDVGQLPIMNGASRGFRPVYIYSAASPETLSQYSQQKQDLIVLALMKASEDKNTTISRTGETVAGPGMNVPTKKNTSSLILLPTTHS